MPESATEKTTGNRLLDRLSKADFNRLLPHWAAVSSPHREEICAQHGAMSHVYFPMRGMISVVGATDEGKVVETATVGNEGMIGIPVILGLDFSPRTAISQVSGQGLRIPATTFFASNGAGWFAG